MFGYVRPGTLAAAFDLLGEGARPMAGGTDLIVGLRKGKLSAELVVDLKGIDELAPGIVEEDGEMVVTSNTVMTDLAGDDRIRSRYPALADAAERVGSIQIRNRATLTGNICNASPAADTAPPLIVHRARVEITGAEGSREMPVAEVMQGPGRTALGPSEIVTRVILPDPAHLQGTAFARLTRRRGVDLATVSVCCGVETDGTVRFVLGAAAPRPLEVTDTTGALVDPDCAPGERTARLEELMAGASPISDVRGSEEYRRAMLVVLAERTLARAQEEMS